MEHLPSKEAIEQAEFFEHLLENDPECIQIRPVINERTDKISFGICVVRADEADEELENVYLMAILVRDGDKLLRNISLYNDTDVVTERPKSNWFKRLWNGITRR